MAHFFEVYTLVWGDVQSPSGEITTNFLILSYTLSKSQTITHITSYSREKLLAVKNEH